jgi:hypothetical protein
MKIDSRGQQYVVYPDGQVRRTAPNGKPLPRVKMSKKERLRLRREYGVIKGLDQKTLVNKILEASVVNPIAMPVSELGTLPDEESKPETADA